MGRIFVLSRSKSWLVIIAVFALVAFAGFWLGQGTFSIPTLSNESVETKPRIIRMVTGEFKSGDIESYRWDPGTVVVQEGEQIELRIYGVNGRSHPFEIRGLGITGEVVKGKETIVHFTAKKVGTYELVCLSHPTIEQDGPMIGYIVVVDD